MKPSAPRAIRLIIHLAIFSLLVAVWPHALASAQTTYHFDLPQYRGVSLPYLLVSTGTVELEDEGGPPVSISFEFSSLVEARFSPEPSGDGLPFDLVLHTPTMRGLGELGAQTIPPFTLRGRLSPEGTLREIETPSFLAELGVDMTDLVVGLIVPAPEASRSAASGMEWRATFHREMVDSERPRSLALTATYTIGRPVDWRGRPLQSVTARLRGDLTLREGLHRTEIQEIGHALFYLRESGLVELSSVSLVTQIETRMPTLRTPISRSKLTLTTTLELQESSPVAAFPVDTTPDPIDDRGSSVTEPTAPAEPAETEESLEADEAIEIGDEFEPAQVGEPVEPARQAEPVVPTEPIVPLEPAAPIETDEPTEPAEAIEPDEADEPVEMSEPVEADATESQSTVETLEPAPSDEPEEKPAADEIEAPIQEPQAEPIAESRNEHGTAEEPETPAPLLTLYRDPAGRFELSLGEEWITPPRSITLRGTTFVTQDGHERAYVYVMPLPSPAATALAIARSALATYGETQTSFRVLVEPEQDHLDGEVAYRAKYSYVLGGERITEWALFARLRDRAYYVQYARVGDPADDDDAGFKKLQALRDHFRFGEHPAGSVPVHHLRGSLTPYVDPAGRFQIDVPSLWPRTELADDGSSTMFTEIGEKGYLSILVQPGASGLTADQIVSAWREQWSREEGFRPLIEVTSAPLAGHEGARFDYAWSGGASGDWARRLQAVVVDDTFVAVAIDYQMAGYAERGPVFDEIIQSFTLLDEQPTPASEPLIDSSASEAPVPPIDDVDEPLAVEQEFESHSADESEPEDVTDMASDVETVGEEKATDETDREDQPGVAEEAEVPAASEELSQQLPAVNVHTDFPFDEPADDQGVLLLGRVLTRYPGPSGEIEESWAKGVQVTVLAGQDEFQGVTDDLGYLYVANLPRLSAGRFYTLTRLDGPMLGFVEPVTVSFDNLRIGQIGPRVAHLRTVIVTLNPNRTLSVEIVRASASAPDDPSALAYFVSAFPSSEWTPHVEEVILSGLD